MRSLISLGRLFTLPRCVKGKLGNANMPPVLIPLLSSRDLQKSSGCCGGDNVDETLHYKQDGKSRELSIVADNQGKATKTRKFAAVKRMMKPSDPRLCVLAQSIKS